MEGFPYLVLTSLLNQLSLHLSQKNLMWKFLKISGRKLSPGNCSFVKENENKKNIFSVRIWSERKFWLTFISCKIALNVTCVRKKLLQWDQHFCFTSKPLNIFPSPSSFPSQSNAAQLDELISPFSREFRQNTIIWMEIAKQTCCQGNGIFLFHLKRHLRYTTLGQSLQSQMRIATYPRGTFRGVRFTKNINGLQISYKRVASD